MAGPTGPPIRALTEALQLVPHGGSGLTAETTSFAVKLGPKTHALAWAGIYTIHAACALYCFSAGSLLDGAQSMGITWELDFYSITLPTKYFHVLARGHYVLGGIHTSFLVVAVLGLMHRITMRFPSSKVIPSRRKSSAPNRMSSQILQSLDKRINRRLKQAVVLIYRRVFSPSGLLGVEFQYFDFLFFLREIVETILQSNQAYQMCRLLTRPALTRFFVGILIINCWTTSLLHHFVASKPLQRLLAHLCDVVLDFVATVAVPVTLVLHYISLYDPSTHDFPPEFWYDDTLFIMGAKEFPIIFFASWVDVISRCMFSIGLLSSLQDIKRLLQVRPRIRLQKTKADLVKRLHQKGFHSRFLAIGHWFMVVYGFGIMGVQFYAETRPNPPTSCALVVKPWLVSQAACAFVEVNCCKQRQLTGNATDFEEIFGDLDVLSLTQFTFRHCPNIEILPKIRAYTNLIGIKLYNSTLASWEVDAAITERLHPRMRYMVLVRTNFTNATLPPGMLSPEFPRLVHDLELSVTNINWIPEDLDTRWPPQIQMVLEYSKLTKYPPVFARVGFHALLLTGNQITSLPAFAIETPGIAEISLNGNPLRHIDEDVDITKMDLYVIDLYETNVSKVPSWMENETYWKRSRYITAGRTPLCENVILRATTEEKKTHTWLRKINCDDTGPDQSNYPLDIEVKNDEVWA